MFNVLVVSKKEANLWHPPAFLYGLICLSVILLNSGCFNTKKTPAKPSATTPPPAKIRTAKPSTSTETPAKPPVDIPKSTDIISKPNPKIETLPSTPTQPTKPAPTAAAAYNIAVLLPFQINALEGDALSDDSRLALELYEGMLVALDQAKQSGFNGNIYVYDSGRAPEQTSPIFAKSEMRTMDLIIGPIFNKPLQIGANFAKANQIHIVSPLSPSTKNTSDNPYYIISSPTIEAQCYAIYKFATQQQYSKRILTISGNKSNEIALANNFTNFARLGKSREGLPEAQVNMLTYNKQSQAEIEALLSPTEENTIVMTTFDEVVINDVVSKLNKLQSQYKITLFGMPNWIDIPTLSFENLVNLNFHITSPAWADPTDPEYLRFKQEFLSRYSAAPSANAAVGYDLIRYFSAMLKTYGKSFPTHFGDTKYSNIHGLYNKFDFQNASPNEYSQTLFTTDYIENKYVNILKYQPNYTFRKVN